uniref:Uncharacterized protein n=1 Tax=Fagus sylvatica TaxID=28930 RepID=A0A2N9EVB7_FAGSY
MFTVSSDGRLTPTVAKAFLHSRRGKGARQTRRWAAESQKRKEHNQRQKGNLEGNMRGVNTDRPMVSYSLCTADNSQTTADS